MLRRLLLLIPVLAFPSLASSTLLQYDIEFDTPWLAPEAGVEIKGEGYLLADTELDAITGGRLWCDEFFFEWTSADPSAMEWAGEYYFEDVVRGGTFEVVDGVSGDSASLELMFWLIGHDGVYSEGLDKHFNEDIWWTLEFSPSDISAAPWKQSPLQLFFTVSPPVVIGDGDSSDIPEPPLIPTLMFGLLLLGLRRKFRMLSHG